MAHAHMPPVPPAARAPQGADKGIVEKPTEHQPAGYRPVDRNLGQQGRQGNIKQNTTNKGLQHDR